MNKTEKQTYYYYVKVEQRYCFEKSQVMKLSDTETDYECNIRQQRSVILRAQKNAGANSDSNAPGDLALASSAVRKRNSLRTPRGI